MNEKQTLTFLRIRSQVTLPILWHSCNFRYKFSVNNKQYYTHSSPSLEDEGSLCDSGREAKTKLPKRRSGRGIVGLLPTERQEALGWGCVEGMRVAHRTWFI